MNMEGLNKSNDSGYRGEGFKYLPHEWEEEMKKLMAQGKTEEEARAELIFKEEDARTKIRRAQEGQGERSNLAA